jgi:class 3 adenylate cyclase
VVGTDEYAEVTEVFNEMAGSLRAQTKQLEARIQENQELLLNILPEPAVAMRRDGDEKATKQFADVSVLMAEIGGLEALGEKMGESGAMSLLGDLVTVFDEVAERVGVEKVRTIGASYLAVCGLSIHRPDHLNRILQFAREITEVVNRVNREHQTQLTIGIGVNTGPVVGGVVGRRKFLYDLWGDTVNLASRLARSGTPAILVTRDVYEKTKDLLSYRPASPMEVPGKGSLAHWQLDPSDT